MPDPARPTPSASWVANLARTTGILGPSTIVDPWAGHMSDDDAWDIAAYGPDRKLISLTTADVSGDLAEPLHVPAGGYVWVRSDLTRGMLPVYVGKACTITRIEEGRRG